MSKVSYVKATYDMEEPVGGNKWTAGESYELIEDEEDFMLASDNGNICCVNKIKEPVLEGFERGTS